MKNIMNEVKRNLADRQWGQGLSRISAAMVPEITYGDVTSLARLMKEIPPSAWDQWNRRSVKIALIGNATLQPHLPILEAFLAIRRIRASIQCFQFNLEGAIYDRDEDLEAFQPDICVLTTQLSDIKNWPQLSFSQEECAQAIENEVQRWLDLAQRLHAWLKCTVIQDGFCLPVDRPLSTLENIHSAGRVQFVRKLNTRLSSQPLSFIKFNDVDYLASQSGRRDWQDLRLWMHGKFPITMDRLPLYCSQLTSLVCAIYGLTKKCLVLDLDNTLWGGVIGDDGLRGIQIGEGSAEGEAFKAFQSYVLRLKHQGVLLAVASKNEDTIARLPFHKSSEMVLKDSDFDAFFANWEPKGDNLQKIATTLNIGVDSLVFFDDNPAEREQVRMSQPDVFVVEAPEDPTDYIERLDSLSLFEPASLTSEDLVRTQLYSQEKQRAVFEKTVGDYQTYLRSLEMEGAIQEFSTDDLPRISQLINKTNQFNVTTTRYTEDECRTFLDSNKYVTRSVRLKDKFGNHGLISAFIGEVKGDTLEINTWLMSCRVLKRTVEQCLMANIALEARKRGLRKIRGIYIPTEKNKMVSTLFSQFGFDAVLESESRTIWELEFPWTLPEHFLKKPGEFNDSRN